MTEDKESTSSSLSQGLTPHDPDDVPKSPPHSPNSSTRKVTNFFNLNLILFKSHFNSGLSVVLGKPSSFGLKLAKCCDN